MTKKANLHWTMGQFENFRLFGSLSYMKEKVSEMEFCIEYIQKNYARITKEDEEEIEVYKKLVKIYRRRIKSME